MPPADLRQGFHLAVDAIADLLRAQAPAAREAAQGLWRRDPAIWSDSTPVRQTIANRLGWLTSPALMLQSVDRLRTMAEGVRRDGVEDIVLLGMGGSSLAPEVLRAIVGVSSGWPRLHMIDSTDPASVRAVATNPARTLFVLASKSGTTIEPNSLAAHFRGVLERARVPRWAAHFIAITDEGTELAARARTDGFRDVFINPSDIGGRYSALSFFGLVPAALMGQDVERLVRWGVAMLEEAAADETPPLANPAVALGLLMAVSARAGRDKLTLVLPNALEPFGLWVEQLVAESTGKQGVGVVPIAGETLGEPDVYGADRIFVRLRTPNVPDEERTDSATRALAPSPVLTIDFPEPSALGAEFARWEIATAVAGALLSINPFDEPNVQQAKDATRGLLTRYQADGHLPSPPPDLREGPVALTLTAAARQSLDGGDARAILRTLEPGDYLGLLAYLGPDPSLRDILHRFRMSVRDLTRRATMFGYGPRYLHSTGQLHKGGPNTGVFVLITARPVEDLEIPGQPFTFGTLELAQGLGDFASLDATGRRGLHIHLPSPEPALLGRVLDTLLKPIGAADEAL